MREITELKEVQGILLDILIYLDQVCREHHLKYFIVDGTLLGAVRHHGFIPWDDDVDVWMPRKDYDRLARYVNRDPSPYQFKTPQNVKGFTYPYGKLIDSRTGIEEKIDVQTEMGLFIDVFPYDGLPAPGTRTYRHFLSKCLFLESQRMASLYTWEQSRARRNGSLYGWLTWRVRRLIGCRRIVRMVDRIARTYPVEGSAMIGCLVAGYKKDQMMEKEIGEDLIELEFEGHRFMAPRNYDRYLTRLYADYWKLPPEDRRVTHLNRSWWKD